MVKEGEEMRVKSFFREVSIIALIIICISAVATAGDFGRKPQKSTMPILRTKEDCIKLAEWHISDHLKYSKTDTFFIGSKLSEPFPYFNAYEETIAYSFDVLKDGKYLAYIEVDRISDSIWADVMSWVSFPRDTFPRSSFAYHNVRNIQKCLKKLENKGFEKGTLQLTHFYYFPGITGGIKRGSSVLAGFKVKSTGKIVLIDPVSLAILPDTVTLMDLQKECEREFPIIQEKARQKQKEHEEYLRKKGVKFNLNFTPGKGSRDGGYNVDFHGEVETWTYDWLKTECVAGACAIVLNYWTAKEFLHKNTPPQAYADDFEKEWGTDGSLPASRIPDDIITAFIDITEKHKLEENPYEFDTKAFIEIHSYYGELVLKHPVDLNFLKGNREIYCQSHACIGVGLMGHINEPKFILYNGWDRLYKDPPYFLNSSYKAVSTWPKGLPPVVISTDPDNGGADVDIDTKISISFDKEMDASTVNSGTVLFNPALHGGFTTEWSGGKCVTLTLTNPDEDLEFYTNYTVTVTDGAKDTSGTQLDGDNDHKPGGNYDFSFTTRLPKVLLSPKPPPKTIEAGHGETFSIEIINNEDRSAEINLEDLIVRDYNGWTTAPVQGSFTLNANETKALSYYVYNGGAEDNLYHSFSLTCNEKDLDNAEHSYAPYEEKEPDHPDEGPVVNPQYPTPWYFDTESQIGILLNGFFEGMGCLLGKYKINTCVVKKENLKVLGDQNRCLNDLSVLIIPTGGLMGLENVASFKQGLKDFIEQGGNVVCLTQQYGYDFYALPDAPSGYGWREDQSCWQGAGYFSDWDVILSGQRTVIVNAHIDGFFTDIPQNSKVIMKRRISGMPELFYYDYGLGKVLVCGLYTDWAYGQGQWSNDEANLIRDIVTWAIDTERPIQEYYAGNEVSLDIPVYYYPDEDTTPANKADIKVLNPKRDSIYSTEIPLSPPLYPGNSTIVSFTNYNAPAILGIYPVNYSLYNDTTLLQKEKLGERFAVKTDIPVGEYLLGDFSIWATAESEKILEGDEAVYTIFLKNSTSSSFVGKVMIGVHEQGGARWEIVDSLLNIEIPADTFITINYSRFLFKSTSTYFGLYDESTNFYYRFWGNAITHCQKGVWIKSAQCPVTIISDKEIYFKGGYAKYNIEIQSHITRPCSVSVRLLDSKSTCWDSLAFGCFLDSTSLYQYSDSVYIDTLFQDDRYCLQVKVLANGKIMGIDREYFIIKTGFIHCTLLPDTEITGLDTFNLGISVEPETLKILGAQLNYKLECPSDTYSVEFIMDSLKNYDTLRIPIMIPDTSLAFGNYNFKYTLFSLDTLNGSYGFANKISFGLRSNSSLYHLGDTLNLSTHIINRGDFSLPVWVIAEVEKPQGNYLDSVQVNLGLKTDTILHFETVIDSGTQDSCYNIWARVRSGTSTLERNRKYRVIVKPPDIMLATDTTDYSIGDTVTVILYNAGELEGDVRLTDVRLQDLQYNSFPFDTARFSIPGGEFAFYKFVVPEVMKGPYYLQITGNEENFNIPINEREDLQINGINADITLNTSKDIYRPADSVVPQANCVNGEYRFDGDMDLFIAPDGLYPGDTTFIPGSDLWPMYYSPGCTLSNNKVTLTGWDKLFNVDWWIIQANAGRDSKGISSKRDMILKVLDEKNKGKPRGSEPIRYTAMASYNGKLYCSITTDIRRKIVGTYPEWQESYDLSDIASIYQFAMDGNYFYIVDIDSAYVYKVLRNSGSIEKRWKVTNPAGIGVLNSNLYVVDGVNHSVLKTDLFGDTVMIFGTDSLVEPKDLAVDSTGRIFVSDLNKQKVYIFNSVGNCIGTEGSGRFSQITVDKKGYLYGADMDSLKVAKYDENGNLIEYYLSAAFPDEIMANDSLLHCTKISVYHDWVTGDVVDNFGRDKGFSTTEIAWIPGIKYIDKFTPTQWANGGRIDWYFMLFLPSKGRQYYKWLPIDTLPYIDVSMTGYECTPFFKAVLTKESAGAPDVEKFDIHYFTRRTGDVVWQDSVDLDFSPLDSVFVERNAGVIPDTGEFIFWGDISLSNGQHYYPSPASYNFFIEPSPISLALRTDKTVYYPGENINTTATVVNNADSAYEDVFLKLLKRETVVFDTVFSTLNPQSACTLSVSLSDSNAFILTGLLFSANLDTVKQFKDVKVETPYIAFSSTYPDSVNHKPFNVKTEVSNWWEREINIVFRTSCGDSEFFDSLLLYPEESRQIEHQFAIARNETLFTGIIEPLVNSRVYPIRFGEKTHITIDSVITSENDVLIPYFAENTGEFDCVFELRLNLTDTTGTITDSVSYTNLLPIGDSLSGEWGANLDYGRYTLNWLAEPESSTVVLSQGLTYVDIIKPDYVTVDSIILKPKCDSTGNLTFNIPVRNSSANTFYGNVGLYADFIYETKGLELEPLLVDTVRFTTNAVLTEGKHALTAKILHNGVPLFERTDSLYFSSNILLDSLPEDLTFNIGDSAAIYIKTLNRGTAIGENHLRLQMGELGEYERAISLIPAEERTDTFITYIPEDMDDRIIYASVWLEGEEHILPIHILGYKILVDASLNQPNFADGDTVVLYLDIANRNERNIKGFSVANYNGEVTTKNFLLSGYANNIDFSNPEFIKATVDSGTYISSVLSLGEFDSIFVRPEGGGNFSFSTRTVESDSVHYSNWTSDSVIKVADQGLLLQFKTDFSDPISYLERINLKVYDSLTVRDTVIETFEPVDLAEIFSFPYDSLTNLMFYGVYTETGRGLWLNTIYVFERNDTCNIITDKQVYNMGDTVSATVQSPYTGRLIWSADFHPFGTISDSLWVDSLMNQFQFVLPSELSSGSYAIDFAFYIDGDTLKEFTSSQSFDVRGYDVDVYECRLDTNEYVPGDSMQIRFKLNSNKQIPLITKLRFTQNYQWYDALCETINADSGFNVIDVATIVPGLERGAAFLSYSFYKDSIFLAHSSEGFMVYVSDTMPPTAQFIQIPENTYNPNTDYTVKITARDETPIYDTLYYYNDYTLNKVRHTSETGDTLIYKIPSQPRGTDIAYYIALTDSFGNSTKVPAIDYNKFWVLGALPPSNCETDTVNRKIEVSWDTPSEGLIYHSGYPYETRTDTFAVRFTPQYLPAELKTVSVYAEKTAPDTGIVNIGFYSVDNGLPGAEVYPPQEIKVTADSVNWIEMGIDSLTLTDEVFIVFSCNGVNLFGDGNKYVYRTLIMDSIWAQDTTFGNLLAHANVYYETDSIFYKVLKEDSSQFVVIADSLTDKTFTDTVVSGEKRYRYLVQTHYITPDLNGTSQILSQVYDYIPPVFGDSVAVVKLDSTYLVGCEITDGIGIALDSLFYTEIGTTHDSIADNWYWYTIPKNVRQGADQSLLLQNDLRRASSATPEDFVTHLKRCGYQSNAGQGLLFPRDSLITYYFIAADSAGNMSRNPDSGYFYITPVIPEGFSGHITRDTTWSENIMIRGDVWVDSGVVLTIESGVNVKFIPDYDYEHSGIDTSRAEFIVNGDLRIIGNDSLYISFTSNATQPEMGDWYGIRYETPDSSLTVEYLTVKYAEQGLSYALNKPFKVKFCEIAFSNTGISSASKFTKITDTELFNNVCGAVINDGFLNMVKRCEFRGNVTGLVLKGETEGNRLQVSCSNLHPVIHHTVYDTPLKRGFYGIASAENKEALLAMTDQLKTSNITPNLFQGQHGINYEILNRVQNDIGQQWRIEEGKFQLALVYDNTFDGNDTGMVFSDCAIGMVRKNEITNNLIGVYITDSALPILGIGMSGQNSFFVESDTLDTLHNYAVYNNTSFYILAEGNWWGTNSEDTIAKIVYDYYDDNNLGIVDFTPFRRASEIFGGEGNSGAQTVSRKSDISKIKFTIPALVKGSNIKVSSYIPRYAQITMYIYDIAGRLTRRIKRIENKGNKSFFIDCGQLRDGIYFIRFNVDGYNETKKIVRLK